MSLTGSPPPSSLPSPSHPPRESSEPLADIRSDGSVTSEAYQSLSENDAHQSKARGPKPPLIPSAIAHDTTRAFGYSPQQLLNPKGFDTKKATDAFSTSANPTLDAEPANSHAEVSFTFQTGGNESSDDEGQDGDLPQNGLRSMIERTHNVSEREHRPTKRAKLEHDSEDGDNSRTKSKFAGGTGRSELGEYVRNGRKEGVQNMGPPSVSSVVDLTAGLSPLPCQDLY